MLVRLMYASRAAERMSHETLHAILKTSARYNSQHGVTGVLCFSDDVFLQVLEGGRSQVSALYNRIATDPRHTAVELLGFEEIDERHFTGWTMGQVDMARLNPSLLLKYSDAAVLDPYSASAKVSMALLNELVATASVMSQG